MAARLKTKYDSEVRSKLSEAFEIKNLHAIPRLEKIVVNSSRISCSICTHRSPDIHHTRTPTPAPELPVHPVEEERAGAEAWLELAAQARAATAADGGDGPNCKAGDANDNRGDRGEAQAAERLIRTRPRCTPSGCTMM